MFRETCTSIFGEKRKKNAVSKVVEVSKSGIMRIRKRKNVFRIKGTVHLLEPKLHNKVTASTNMKAKSKIFTRS